MNSRNDHEAERPELLPRIERPFEFFVDELFWGVELLREVVRKFLPTLFVTFFDGDARLF